MIIQFWTVQIANYYLFIQIPIGIPNVSNFFSCLVKFSRHYRGCNNDFLTVSVLKLYHAIVLVATQSVYFSVLANPRTGQHCQEQCRNLEEKSRNLSTQRWWRHQRRNVSRFGRLNLRHLSSFCYEKKLPGSFIFRHWKRRKTVTYLFFCTEKIKLKNNYFHWRNLKFSRITVSYFIWLL